MNRFIEDRTTFILDQNADLYFLPFYLDTRSINDPIIRTFFDDHFPEEKEKFFASYSKYHSGQILTYTEEDGPKYKIVMIKPLKDGNIDILIPILTAIENEINKEHCHEIALAQLGVSDYGFPEAEARKLQRENWLSFVKKHTEYKIYLSLLDSNHRLQGHYIKIEEQNLNTDSEQSMELDRNQVIVEEENVINYLNYFELYFNQRVKISQCVPILSYDDFTDFKSWLKVVCQEFKINSHKRLNYSKWAHVTKGNSQAPYKQTLKFLILMADMSYQEAIACMTFFGYGFARFNVEDQLFVSFLKNKNNTFDIDDLNSTLIQRFGEKASLYYTGKNYIKED